jgi:hypothetical protein
MPAQLLLQNRATLNQRSPRVGLWLLVGATFVIIGLMVAVLYLIALQSGKPVDWGTILAKLLTKLREDPFRLSFLAVGMLASVLQVFYIALAKQRERLVLDELGIRYASPLPKFLAHISPSWSLQWSQVRRAVLTINAYAR